MPTEHVLTAVVTRDGLNPAVGQEFMASIKGRVEESEVSWQQNSEFENCGTCLPPTKLISLQRQSNGFGFTLRHFVVYPPELIRRSSETGLSPFNGLENHVDDVDGQKVEPMDTVFVRQVAPSGPADRAGLSTGDQIVSVNGHPVIGRSYSQVIQLIQSSQELLELGIIPKEDCVLQMVTPIVSVPPKITGSVCEFSQTPPPVKPKPIVRRLSNQESPARVMSTVTINPTNSYHLKLSDKDSESSSVSDSYSPVASVTLRRGSVDRTAMENRSFVITSENVDYSSNLKSRSSSAMESGTVSSTPMDGSYFMATTDSMGRPFALHFEKGSKFGNTLPVLEDPIAKNRSHSLPMVEFGNEKKGGKDAYSDSSDANGAKSLNGGLNFIPPFTLSAPRTVVSDGPSTTYVSTNSDVGSRQPVAANPGYRTGRPSYEASTSHLIRTIASHMRKDRQIALRSSTVGATLLESKDGDRQRSHGSSDGCQQPESASNGDAQQNTDSPHPAKVRRQSHDNVKQATFSSEVSMFPNKPTYDEMVFTASFGAKVSVPDTSATTVPAKQGSPKPRRVSYLMATSGVGETLTPADQKVWGTAPQGRRGGKPTVLEGLSTTLQPVMVHVSSGMELCEDSNRDEGVDIPPDEIAEDEVFQGSAEEKSTDGSVQKSNRRVSYVMATSSPTSPRHQTSFEALKEDVVEEVHKEGFLWRKCIVTDSGKIFQRSSAKSWKLVFAVLRGHVLCLYKDEAFAHQEDISDEQPISIKSSLVDIAHDYTKKKNVFRVTTFNGSGYLFQAENHEAMMSWITAIKENSNPDDDEGGVTSQSLIIRRMKTVEQETSGSNSSSPIHKLSPPINTKISSIPGISNIKKSISFRSITTGQKGESGKSQGNKANKKRKKPPVTNTYPSGHSVGVPLEMCPSCKRNKFIPLIVEHCCEVVERKGLETVGVYRVPGNSAAVTALVEELNSRGIENVCLEDDKWNDVNNITSLFKQFLRKLPEGLVTAELYDGFIEANKREDPTDRMWSLRSMVQDLPDHSFETLKLLTRHLRLVSENCDKNKMEVRNLAIVFGPTLVRTGDDSMMSLVKDMSDQCRIVETLISECEWFFEESDGDEFPVKVPFTCQEHVQGDLLSQNVLCSLGQAAVNFGDDGSYKHKTSGKSLHIPKFRSSKTSKSDVGQGSSSDGVVSDSQGSEGSPPMERAPAIKNVTSDGSRSNSPTMERSTRLVGKKAVDNLSAVQIVIDPYDTDIKPKGTGSLKAYSYAHPPPPSYRRVNQRRAASPGPTESLAFSPHEATVTLCSEAEVKKSVEEVSNDVDSTPKPSFSSFSEETRLRLLKMSLQQKAAEKRRQSEREMQATSPPPPVDKSDDTARDLPRDIARDVMRKASDQENLENVEQLSSSSSNSRSSSTLSSKNPSLDSLHVIPQSDKVTISTGVAYTEPDVSAALPVMVPSEALRVNSNLQLSSQTNTRLDVKPRSYETVVAVIHGRGVVAGTPQQFEAALRPASSEIRARRESAEERRLAVGSESSDTSSDEEGESATINMDKSFNEKLRMLLDLENTFGIKGRRGGDLQSDDDRASVSSEPQKTRVSNDMNNVPRQVFEEPVVRTYQVVGRKAPSHSEKSLSRRSTSEYNVTREEHPLEAMNCEHSTEKSGTNHSGNAPDKECAGRRMSSRATHLPMEESPESSKTQKVGLLRQRFEGGQAKSPRSSLGGEIKHLTKNSLDRHEAPPVARKKIGSVHTTTPVSLKEFNVRPASAKRDPTQSAPVRDMARSQQHDESQRILTSKSIRLESSPAKHLSTIPAQYGMSRSEGGSVRSGISINLSSSDRFKAQPSVSNTHVPPRVISREVGTKSKLLSHKDSTKELLPSKTTIPSKDISGSQTRRKLEKDAQHIADLLQEMHSERDLFLSRQQSDISGQAQKAAAQRAAMRRRRRSLGDGNDSGVRKPTSPTEKGCNISGYKRTGMPKGTASYWPGDVEERKRLPHHGRTSAQSFNR